MERLVLDLILLVTFLGISAFLAGAEAAYFSLTRLGSAHLEPEESPGHAILVRVLRDPHDLLITLLVGITLVNIAASALATQVATTLFGPRGIGVAIPAMVFLIVVFGEVLPMTIAVGMPHRFGVLVARPVLALQWLLTPVRLLLGAFTHLVSRAADGEGVAKAAITEAELRTLVEVGHQEGVVQRKEREMIHGVFELGETTVAEVMVPRTDVFGIDVGTPADRLLTAIRANLHHRVPVYEGSLDHVLGILLVKELLPFYAGLPPDFDLRAHLTAPYFVPQSKRADALLREFKAKKLRMAIVVDEYGGTAGLVTLEDLLEEVVGEIRDEFESEERLAQPVDERTWRVAAKMSIGDFNAVTGLSIPDEHFDTVGGWVLDVFGRVPHRGESVETDGIRITVETLHRNRILQVLVRLPARPDIRPVAPDGVPAGDTDAGSGGGA
ncbi:MAG TPA: hemolysin family protein [Methylomirabilota bacterium]|jgi:putative hemolysin